MFFWNPITGPKILVPYDPLKMAVTVANDIFCSNDSIIVTGSWGLSIFKNDSIVFNLLDGNAEFHKILPYQNGYLLAFGGGQYLNNEFTGQLVYWEPSTGFEQFQNISNFISNDAIINSIALFNDEIYVGGNASSGSGGVMDEILHWNGTMWAPIGGGILDVSNLGGINDIVVYKDDVYFGGQFVQNNNSGENHIARWSGTEWLSVGGGIESENASIYELKVIDNFLYAVGSFTEIGGIQAKGIARWDGEKWCSCGAEINGVVKTITEFNDTLYIGGNFSVIDQDSIPKVAKFVGKEFDKTCGFSTSSDAGIVLSDFDIFPNPIKNKVIIHVGTRIQNEVNYVIYNLLGQVELFGKTKGNTDQIILNTNELVRGVYILEISAGTTKEVFQLIK
jgi:hypothetical protein